MNYILSQVFIILCYAMIGISYLAKSRKAVLFYSLISVVFNGLSYFFLSAWTGLAMIGVALLRNVLFMIQDKSRKIETQKTTQNSRIFVLILLIAVSIIFGILTFENIFSLFAVSSTIIYTYALWQENVDIYKLLGLIAEISGLIYYAFIRSLFGVILEVVVIIVSLVGVIKYFKNKDKKNLEEVKNESN